MFGMPAGRPLESPKVVRIGSRIKFGSNGPLKNGWNFDPDAMKRPSDQKTASHDKINHTPPARDRSGGPKGPLGPIWAHGVPWLRAKAIRIGRACAPNFFAPAPFGDTHSVLDATNSFTPDLISFLEDALGDAPFHDGEEEHECATTSGKFKCLGWWGSDIVFS